MPFLDTVKPYQAFDGRDHQTLGLSMSEVQLIIQGMLDEYTGAAQLSTKVYPDKISAFSVDRAKKLGKKTTGGYYPKSRAFVYFADGFTNKADVRKAFRHEVFVHYGLNLFLPETKQGVVDSILKTQDKLAFKSAWDYVNTHYEGQSDELKAEEVIAYVAENPRNALQQAYDYLANLVINAFRKINLIKPNELVSKSEIHQLVYDMSQAIKYNHPQQNFPKSDQVQFRTEKDVIDDSQIEILDKFDNENKSKMNKNKKMTMA